MVIKLTEKRLNSTPVGEELHFEEELTLFQQLHQKEFCRVAKLIVNSNHELCIQSVIKGEIPGAIYTDDSEQPQSALIMTPECNVVVGYAGNPEFNAGVKGKLDFNEDPIMCDTEEWEHHISDIHSNVAVKKYTRRYYQLSKLSLPNFMELLSDKYTVEYVYADSQDYLQYENAEHVAHWFNFTNIEDFQGYCLGAYVRTGNKIVSWCLADCMVDDKMEVGIQTDPEFRRQGLGTIAVAATVRQCLASGINQIGWHCVDSNIGSYTVAERVGFVKVKEYNSFTPYPPIENITDLNDAQWAQWGEHYDRMNQIEPRYHWQAAQCWAFAHHVSKTIRNVKSIWDSGQTIQRDILLEQCSSLQGNEQWDRFISTLVWD